MIELAQEGMFDVIIHGCNCFCTMGAGIAKFIKIEFPEAFEADKLTKIGDRSKLGNITYANIIRNERYLIVVNGYTQYHYYGKPPLVDYKALRSVFKNVSLLFHGARIGYPRIGAGEAKGKWYIISGIIEEELSGEDHTLVIL